MIQQIALVTGASSGIGRATAQLLAENGYYVFAGARRMDRLEQIRSDNIEPFELDVTNSKAIQSMVDHVISRRGRIDVLVNNAGFGQLGTIECVSMEAAHRQFEVNVFGYANFMQAVLPHMRTQKSGRIVNITSVSHGINTVDQLGRTAPTNAPLALQKLLQLWRTNSANAYSLTVSNGTGGGSFGAGSIVTLTANPAPSGTLFAGWTGASVASPNTTTTLFIMPTNNATVLALFTNLPAPTITAWQFAGGTSLVLTCTAYPSRPWAFESSTNLVNWVSVGTNFSDALGALLFTNPFSPGVPSQFFRVRSP